MLATSFPLLPELRSALTAPELSQTECAHPDHCDLLCGRLGELAARSPSGSCDETRAGPSSGVLPCAPAAVCSRFPGELPHCLETALLVNNWG